MKDNKIECDLQLFLSLVEMRRQYKIYSEFHEILQKDIDDIGLFTLKDERLPELIQELSDISCFEYVADDHRSVDENNQSVQEKFQKNQGCQIDPSVFGDLEAMKKDKACNIDKDEIDTNENLVDIQVDDDDDVACGSSEEVPEKSFWKITSCSLVKEVNLSNWIESVFCLTARQCCVKLDMVI